ncbi:MAG: DNA-binding domain-containing protein [Gammaproteobacteria bacterium]|jgi:hypothetical protein
MPTLHEIQRQFCEALLEHDPAHISDQIRADFIGVKTGLEVYRNNVFTNLREALRTLFPVINKLVGEAFFNYTTEHFIHDYPSPAGDLNQYGGDFAEFLTAFEPASSLVYLPDVARLEWAIHLVYHARNAAELDRQRLSLIPPGEYGDLRFKLNPACRLVQSAYPVNDIWQVNQPDYAGDPRVELDKGGVSLLVARHGDHIVLDPLTAGETAFLSTIARHEPFSRACTQAMHADPTFSLKLAVNTYIQNNVLVDFELHKQSTTTPERTDKRGQQHDIHS